MRGVAFTAAARAVYQVTRDPEDEHRRIFVASKNNLGPDTGGFSFTLERAVIPGGVETSRIRWGDAVDMTANETLAAAQAGPDLGAREAAEDFLETTLADGPVNAETVKQRAQREGIKFRTLRRAADRLGIRPAKTSGSGPWTWSLPRETLGDDEGDQGGQGGQLQRLDTLDTLPPTDPAPNSTQVETDAQARARIDRLIYGDTVDFTPD